MANELANACLFTHQADIRIPNQYKSHSVLLLNLHYVQWLVANFVLLLFSVGRVVYSQFSRAFWLKQLPAVSGR